MSDLGQDGKAVAEDLNVEEVWGKMSKSASEPPGVKPMEMWLGGDGLLEDEVDDDDELELE